MKAFGIVLAHVAIIDAFTAPRAFFPANKISTKLEATSDEEYDFIVCGLGYAGAIMTARLAERNPDKKILAIEYGGPIQAKTGGASNKFTDIDMVATMFQSEGAKVEGKTTYDPDGPMCMADVPGNYNNVAFRPLTDRYQLPEFNACFQGTGLGGNGVYNGALYQEPANWWWDDEVHNDIFVSEEDQKKGLKTSDILKPYFDKVKEELKGAINPHPSSDKVHYNHGLYDLVKPLLKDSQFTELEINITKLEEEGKLEETGELENAGDRFFTVPSVNTLHGTRTGASHWLEKFMTPEGTVREEYNERVTVQMYTEVLDVILGDDNEVTGVNVIENIMAQKRGGRQYIEQSPATYKVKKGGKVILSCNALPTNRILYKSGIGPEAVREYVMPSTKTSEFTFKVNNEAIGTTINEHVTTSLGFRYKGDDKPQPDTIHFNPGDFNGNAKHLQDYATERKGPFTQFGPVVASHFIADMSRCKDLPGYSEGLEDGYVTTELFYNPFGAGKYPPVNNLSLNPYNGPGTFTVYVMLLRPEMRAFFRLDENDKAQYVECYMQDEPQPTDPDEETRAKLGLPDYRALAKRDIATMTASVHEVLEITKRDNIEIALGPGDGSTTLQVVLQDNENKPVSVLDSTDIDHVKGYVTLFDHPYSVVNGEYLAITRLQENHYHSSTPLARNLDVFGKPLGNRKDTYGLDPDTCEVKGTKGLCVVDAGMFPKVVYCHPIGSVMALAEWAADKISPPEHE